jgi:hypothetical protein
VIRETDKIVATSCLPKGIERKNVCDCSYLAQLPGQIILLRAWYMIFVFLGINPTIKLREYT